MLRLRSSAGFVWWSRAIDPATIGLDNARGTIANFPRRPDAGVLSKSIPLFFIGRNRNSLWVAREAEGRTGGVFLLKQSALHFAQRKSAPSDAQRCSLPSDFDLRLVRGWAGLRRRAMVAPLVGAVVDRAEPCVAARWTSCSDCWASDRPYFGLNGEARNT
jgi:hypothetical protein